MDGHVRLRLPSRRSSFGFDGGLEVRCVPELEDTLREVYSHHDWFYDRLREEKHAGRLRGRLPVLTGSIDGMQVVVKRLYHGGKTAWLSRDRFFSASRVRAFLAAASYLAERRIPTPRVLFASWRRRNGFVRAEIGFERIFGKDADHFFFERPTPPANWLEESVRIGEMVAALHRVGFLHGDLNLMNIFLEEDGTVFILDLDKAVHRDGAIRVRERERNLARLERSIRKQGRAHDAALVDEIVRGVRAGYEATGRP